MNTSAIAARVKVCTLKTGAFRPVKKHGAETKAENERHGTEAVEGVRVRLTSHPALDNIRKIHSEAYQFHTRLTRPTIDEAIRLLPLCRELEHAQGIAKFAAQHEAARDLFIAAYPGELATAQERLGTLYDARLFPSVTEIEAKFRFESRYLPCPTEGEWKDWLSASAVAAQAELRDELQAALKRVAERCASDGRLFQTVFSNLRELLDMVPDLNLTEDPTIIAAMQQAQAIADADKDEVAANPSKRQQLAQEAARIASMFSPASFAAAS